MPSLPMTRRGLFGVLAGVFVLAMTANAQEKVHAGPPKSWSISVGFVIGTSALDAISSRGMIEQNPLMGRGDFGARQEAMKGATVGALIAGEYLFLRKHPSMTKAATAANWVYGGTTMILGPAHNWRQ